MADPTTTTIQLAIPTRGSDVGVWDTPVNGNMSILDSILGVTIDVVLSNSNVVLSAGQFQGKYLIFTGNLGANVSITFPTSFTKSYEVRNFCQGAFTITLLTTAASNIPIGCPPGTIFEVLNDGFSVQFKNFGLVGTYWAYAGSSVPAWLSACSVTPYLLANGTTFSSATFPALRDVLGSNTVPNSGSGFATGITFIRSA